MPSDLYGKPYADSSLFIAFIKGEWTVNCDGDKRCDVVQRVFEQMEEANKPIYTSTLTRAEVHLGKPPPGSTDPAVKLTDAQDESILEFLKRDLFISIDVDTEIGNEATRLARKHGIAPNDATHLASALRAGCDALWAWDKRFEKVRHPKIKVEEPRIKRQRTLIQVEKA